MFIHETPLVDTDPASVNANYVGQITAEQHARFKPPSLILGLLGLAGAAGIVYFGSQIGLILWDVLSAFANERDAGVPLWLPLLILGFFVVLGVQGIVGLVWTCRPFLRWLLFRLDIAEGRIVQDDGYIVFRRGRYIAKVAGRSLKATDGRKRLNLAPGAYRFFYLPRTGRILSAQPLQYDESYGASAFTQGLLDALAQTNHFDMDDLLANRQGRLSSKQAARVLRSAILWLVGGSIVAALIVVFGIIEERSLWAWVGLALCVLVTGSFCYALLRDLQGGRVLMVEGLVDRWVSVHDKGSGYSYYYVLDGKRFGVSHDAYNALVVGIRYRLYYAPKSGILTSIEPVP